MLKENYVVLVWTGNTETFLYTQKKSPKGELGVLAGRRKRVFTEEEAVKLLDLYKRFSHYKASAHRIVCIDSKRKVDYPMNMFSDEDEGEYFDPCTWEKVFEESDRRMGVK